MTSYTLERPGDRPLTFTGEMLAESEGRVRRGKENTRWHDVRVYRTAGGTFVVEIAYTTEWKGEEGHRLVRTAGTAEAVHEILSTYEPLAHVVGYPPGETYAEKQRRLELAIVSQYRAQVGELLAEHPDLFAEVLE
jgi:hypothetical protein